MAARDGAASVQGDAIKITPLLIDGSIDSTKPILTSEGFISASFSADVEEGEEITERAANGKICIQYKADDSMTGITMSLSVCSPDPEITALLAGGRVLAMNDAGTITIEGYTSPPVGGTVGSPVAIEIWSKAIINGKPAANKPYWHWVFPYVRLRYDGDREFSNGALANEFSGSGVGNDALAINGLNPVNAGDDFVKYKSALVNPFSYVRDYSLPPLGWSGAFDTSSPDVALVVNVLSVSGATAGSPGSFTPAEATLPENLAALRDEGMALGASWAMRDIGTTGEWVVLGDGSKATWNGTTWVTVSNTSSDVSDLAPEAAAFPDLTTLKADAVYGDGAFDGGTFDTGQYIRLTDNSQAYYNGTIWTAGVAP